MKSMKISWLTFFSLVALLCASCAPEMHLNTQGAMESEIKGTYRVIFVGCNFTDDLETIAFLQKEDSRYTFEPYLPDFQYRVEKGVPASDALASAEKFLKCTTSFRRSQLSSIIAPDGSVLGYEVRPLYFPLTYGIDDVLETNYFIRGDKVLISIRQTQRIERIHRGGAGDVWGGR